MERAAEKATEKVKNRFERQMESIDQNIKGLKLKKNIVSKQKNLADHQKKTGGGGTGMVVLLVLAIIVALASSSFLAYMMSNPASQEV